MMKKIILVTMSFFFSISLLIIAGEVSIRLYHYVKKSVNKSSRTIALDDELGWVPLPNYIYAGEKLDASGKKFKVDINTDSNGFRMFGKINEKGKIKIFFIGDSFTHALEVSDEKTYYGRLGDILPIEVFAFGGVGYGTMQEYMILDKYIDDIQPDIVVVQLCSNDFINNSYDLEMSSNRSNNGFRRPYFEKGSIIYRTPKNLPTIRNFLYEYSRFFYYFIRAFDRLDALKNDSVEDIIKENGRLYPDFEKSILTTEILLNKFKKRTPPTTLICAFVVDESDPYYHEFKRICKKIGIYFIDDIPQALKAAELRGITTRSSDKTHWNEMGHQITSNVLKSHFEEIIAYLRE